MTELNEGSSSDRISDFSQIPSLINDVLRDPKYTAEEVEELASEALKGAGNLLGNKSMHSGENLISHETQLPPPNAFTWHRGRLSHGLELQADPQLGEIVYLGEKGRGRYYEKVALGRRNPPGVREGRVYNIHPVEITLPAREGKPEKNFHILENHAGPSDETFVRVNTEWVYTKHTHGGWRAENGSPRAIVSGTGAHGAAGTIGSWIDSLVGLNEGDVIRITPEGGHKVQPWALWVEGGRPQTCPWRDWEQLQALKRTEGDLREGHESLKEPEVLVGTLPAYTFAQGRLTQGIGVEHDVAGAAVHVGEAGRGRELKKVSLVGFDVPRVDKAAVMVMDEATIAPVYPWEKPQTTRTLGLTQNAPEEPGALVLIDTSWVYTKNSRGGWEALRGTPETLTKGWRAHGAAGNTASTSVGLVVIREGDVLRVEPDGAFKTQSYALFLKDNQLHSQRWLEWLKDDIATNPRPDAAAIDAVPESWRGKVVTIKDIRVNEHQSSVVPKGEHLILRDAFTGEVVNTNPLTLNLGYNGTSYREVVVDTGAWAKLRDEIEVKHLTPDQLAEREGVIASANALRDHIQELTTRPGYDKIGISRNNKLTELLGSDLAKMTTAEIREYLAVAQPTVTAIDSEMPQWEQFRKAQVLSRRAEELSGLEALLPEDIRERLRGFSAVQGKLQSPENVNAFLEEIEPVIAEAAEKLMPFQEIIEAAGSEPMAQSAVNFARKAEELIGSTLAIIEKELNAPYGKDRKIAGLRKVFPELYIPTTRASDLDAFLRAAKIYLQQPREDRDVPEQVIEETNEVNLEEALQALEKKYGRHR